LDRAAEEMTIALGTKLGRYEIRSLIGAGGMGEVYLAQDTKLDRKVALKILPAEVAANQDRMDRFVREAKSAAALNHPNIAHIYEIGESDGVNFIAMEFIDGVTLRDKIYRERADLGKLLKTLQQVAEGLSKAHAAGIVHRDLKPDNIMITRDGFAKVLDFGLAKLIEKSGPALDQIEGSNAPTNVMQQGSIPGMVMGTVGYMSPEQAQGKTNEIDQRSDIFSFGCILFEAITGKKAFEGDSVIKSLHSLIYEPTPQIKELNPSAPSDLERIVGRCLEKDPEERYQTIKDVAIELKHLRRGMTDPIDAHTATALSTRQNTSAYDSQDSSSNSSLRTEPAAAFSTRSSSVKYIVTGVKRHRLAALLSLALVVGIVAFAAYRVATKANAAIESIAVMPFVNESGNADVEYLSDGMTEALIRSLSQLPNLNVKARSSVFRYKGKEANPQTIGKELNVQAILTGRVVQRGDQLTLSLELIDAHTENVVWSEQYNRKQADLVSLQSEIARDVSSKLKTKLSGADQQRLAKTYTANPEAYQHYLRGRFYWNKRNAENIRKAIEQFKAAAEKDPGFALAYSGLADCYVVLPNYAGTWTSETLPSARAYATRAIEIDGSLGEAQASLGFVHLFAWNFVEAESAFKRSIELNPNYPTAHHWYSRYLRAMGRSDEALAVIKRAKELDPLSLVILNNIAENYLERGDMTLALDECKRMRELDPNYFGAYQTLCIIYSIQGRLPEALAAAQKSVELSNRSNGTLVLVGFVQGKSGRRDAAQSVIDELERKHAIKEADGRDLAIVYMGLNEKDKAFEWLEKSYQNRGYFMALLRLEPLFEPLHDDPRWNDLLRRIGLPQ